MDDGDERAHRSQLHADDVNISQPPSPAIGVASSFSVPEIPSSTEFRKDAKRAVTRSVSINNRPENAIKMFPTNIIRTSKYTLLTFLPINLFEQFRRIANFYFLVIICISIPQDWAPYPWYTTAMPLVFILAISGVKDGYEDFLRHREDRVANQRVFKQVGSNSQLSEIASGNIAVGDIIRVDDGQEFPADLIVLLTSKHDNTCYVNTANLDGEVTPKLRLGTIASDSLPSATEFQLSALSGSKVESGDPCKQLDGFEGTLTLSNGVKKPLGDRQVLLRGAKLRGTQFVFAVVFATGPETKLMLNRNPIRFKFSTFEKILNQCVLASLVLEFSLCLVMVFLSHFQNVQTLSDADMIMMGVERNQNFVAELKLFVTSFILYSFLIPVSLFVTIDFVKIGQAMVIEMDEHMSIPATNADKAEGILRVYSTVKSSNLNDDLGQVEYLFTDKTGTLTCNRMELSSISTDGFISVNQKIEIKSANASAPSGAQTDEHRLSNASEQQRNALALENLINWAFRNITENRPVDDLTALSQRQHSTNLKLAHTVDVSAVLAEKSFSKSEKTAQDMLFSMLVCNDVQPETDGKKTEFVSTSPDEIALVDALSRNGMKLISAGPSQPWVIKLDCAPSVTFTFKRVAQLDFSSDRRRMTVVVQVPDGSTVLYTKGASSTIEPLLASDSGNRLVLSETQKHLSQFAKHGSRTLMMASRTLDAIKLGEFVKVYEQATVQLQGREKAIEKAFQMIEKDLHLLGVTSVEDQLQELVPETIQQLLDAGVTIMMLTGDMQETAVTIGRSSRIISKDSKLIFIQADTPKQCGFLLDRYIRKADEASEKHKLAMVLNGNTLEMAIQHYADKFLLLFAKCETIICNRATPSQKAFVVALVTSRFKGVTMAIGDGANDVSMIRRAHVGVGLIGREGRQAAQSADFVLHRFNHLRRLLFVHGRYSYQRSSKVVLFSFFKNFLYPLPLFWFACFSQFSGQSIYDSLIITNFNMFFSSLPPLVAGVLEKDVSESSLLKHPLAYKAFRQQKTFSVSIFLLWLLLGTYQSLVIYFSAHIFFAPSEGDLANGSGMILDMWTFGTWIGTSAILNVNLSFLVKSTNLTVATIVCSMAGIACYLAFLVAYNSWFPKIAPNMYGMNEFVFGTPTAYLYYLLTFLLCLVPILVLNLKYQPSYSTILREYCTPANANSKIGEIGCCLTDHVPNANLDSTWVKNVNEAAVKTVSTSEHLQDEKYSLSARGRSNSEGLHIQIDIARKGESPIEAVPLEVEAVVNSPELT